MKLFLPIVYFLCLSRKAFGQDDDAILSYQDLKNLNSSCYPWDTCMGDKINDFVAPKYDYNCGCNRQCWEFGTCCIDSPYRGKPPTHKCIKVTKDTVGYYMVYRCPENTYSNSIWKIQCEKEWSGEDDILRLSPVTSLKTSVTYKNYYCFRCHERTDEYISWDLSIESSNKAFEEMRDYSVAYNQARNTWVATKDEDDISIPVNLRFVSPHEKQTQLISRLVSCEPMISDCPNNWTDEHVRYKCLAYTAVVYQGYTLYKNAHCALCNYASLDTISCFLDVIESRVKPKSAFSFKDLINMNDPAEDKVGNNKNCDVNHLWDPYFKRCQKLKCAMPGYVIKDSQCVKP